MIEADGLGKRWGDSVGLEGMDLRVARGEVFGCLGPNGAGKSTATKLLCTLLAPTSGTARVCGFDVVRESAEVRRRIGYLPEKVPVYKPLTAREDLRYFGRLHGMPLASLDEAIEKALARVQLEGVEHKRAGTFSKGMVQRLGIARALLHEPEVVFFDEPATGLDPTGRRMIRTIMQELGAEGCTVFLCSHDLGEVRAVAQRIGFIRKGQLVQVRSVGPDADTRVVDLEAEGDIDRVAEAVRALAGVRSVTSSAHGLRIEGDGTLDRRAVARQVAACGAVLLDIGEREVPLDVLYQQYVEEDAPTRVPIDAPRKEVRA